MHTIKMLPQKIHDKPTFTNVFSDIMAIAYQHYQLWSVQPSVERPPD